MLRTYIAVDAIAGARGIIGLCDAKLATKGDSQIIVGLVKFSFKGVGEDESLGGGSTMFGLLLKIVM